MYSSRVARWHSCKRCNQWKYKLNVFKHSYTSYVIYCTKRIPTLNSVRVKLFSAVSIDADLYKSVLKRFQVAGIDSVPGGGAASTDLKVSHLNLGSYSFFVKPYLSSSTLIYLTKLFEWSRNLIRCHQNSTLPVCVVDVWRQHFSTTGSNHRGHVLYHN